ncbi:cAMP-independent regulatory protein pac2 [Tolypocladium capitatum]|uniref:cAMP-independent regulatory protein pac2 n=1 Tax=Tolypocladium capitatum TaxID=45235 RepID=A0A2K3QCW4_9HYPO|nr:cAMP-independent regulatory protein pac2 [Tolypocladium capitatum]
METYHGYMRTPADAIKLFEACRLGLLPRVQRRLSEKERQSIRSGSVFVWDEREAGMRRWTDGKSWSASRVSGSFLTYREMEGKRGGGFGGGGRRGAGKTPDSGRGSDEDHDEGEPEGYRYKADGLMKQSFSITTSTGQHLHLISYYSRPQPGQPDLPQPSSDPSLRGIAPPKGMYPESSMGETNQTPALTRTPMQQPYMIAPHHAHAHHQQQPYAPHYAQPGYGWPPSPAATPPYGHSMPAPYPPHAYSQSHAQPPSQPPSQSHYTHAPPYERASLPPLHNPKPATLPPYPGHHASHGPSPRRLHDSPRQKDLQAAVQAVVADVHLGSGSARSPRGPLPALNAVANATPASSHAAMVTPLMRHLSASPTRTSHVDARGPFAGGGHRTSISALLHPTPASSEPTGAKPTSGGGGGGSDGGSPRANCAAAAKGGVSEDARALRMLDRKFCI